MTTKSIFNTADVSVGDLVEVTLLKNGYWNGTAHGRVVKVNPATNRVSIDSSKFRPNAVRSFNLAAGNVRTM